MLCASVWLMLSSMLYSHGCRQKMFKKCKICIYKLFNILPAKPDILRL